MKETVTHFVKNNWAYFFGSAVGAIIGFLYWRFIGCLTGSCPIQSSILLSTVFGAVFGGLSLSIVVDFFSTGSE